MSSILKALKKLENDKAICKPDQLGIDAKILQNGPAARFSPTAVSLFAIALFVCGSGATYLYMKHDATDAGVPQTISSRTESHSQPPLSAVILPVSKSGTLQTTTTPLSSPKAPPVFGASTPSPNNPAKLSRPSQPGNQIEPAPRPELRPAVSMPATPTNAVIRPSLTINGIAFQDGGSENLAVINGITVSNGAVIEGVRVEDIQKDRVRFSQGGEKFEIILNKSNR